MTSNVNAIALSAPHGSLARQQGHGAPRFANASVLTEQALSASGHKNLTTTSVTVPAHLGSKDLAPGSP
jgi:hypothetical protein